MSDCDGRDDDNEEFDSDLDCHDGRQLDCDFYSGLDGGERGGDADDDHDDYDDDYDDDDDGCRED